MRTRSTDFSDIDKFMQERGEGKENDSNSQSTPTPPAGGSTAQTDNGWQVLGEAEPTETEHPRPPLTRRKQNRAAEVFGQTPLPHDLPPRPINPNRLPACAKEWADVGPTGHGVFSFDNGTSEDAIVHLFISSASYPVRSVYVPSHKKCEIDNLEPESYTLRYATGLDWDPSKHDFNWGASYFQPDKNFTYTEELDSDGTTVNFVEREITLHTVPLGNLNRHRISKEDFLRK